MALLDRSSKTPPTARKSAPALTHEQLRALPIGYDVPSSPLYVDPADRELYAAIASNEPRMRGWRDSAAWTCSGIEVDPVTRKRVARAVDPDTLVHRWVLEEVARARQARARWAEQAAERHAESLCAVCHEGPQGDTLTDLYVVTGRDVLLPAFGVTGRSVMLHEACAAALRHALVARIPEPTRQLAAAYAATL